MKEFFEANNAIWKKHKSPLFFTFAGTFTVWILEWLFDLTILGGLPAHWYPEWCAFFYSGYFTAEVKKTLIPTELLILTSYLLTVFLGLFIVRLHSSAFPFMLLFLSPVLLGYLVKRISNLRKARSVKKECLNPGF